MTDNGAQFTYLPRGKSHEKLHLFDQICAEHGIKHRLTKPDHPWTNGQVERMNKTIKKATVHRYYYSSHDQLRDHLQAFIDAYNFAKNLKALNGLTPFDFIQKQWCVSPDLFKFDLLIYTLKPDT